MSAKNKTMEDLIKDLRAKEQNWSRGWLRRQAMQRKDGKQTARERIDALVDADSFEESGLFAQHRQTLFEIFEPEQPHPGYYSPPGHTRVLDAAPIAPPAVRSSGGSALVADEGKVCRSPFSGSVSKISAQAGQTIQINDVLLVLEAMKMETVITAPIARQGRQG